MKKSITEFKAQLGIGESIIISDNKSGIVGLTAGYAFDKVLQAQANLAGSLVAVKRLHIFRRDENTIQVYRTPADYNLLSAGIGVEAYIPILKLSLARKAGEAETSFYSISIKAPRDKADREASQGQEIEEETVDPKDLQDMAKNLRALHHLLLSNSTTELDKLRKPARIGHKFAEVMKNGQFFHHRRMNLNSLDGITVHHPEGGSKRFVYRSDSQISGKNFESLAIDVLSVGLEKGLKLEDVVVGEPGENMPGSGLYGSSVSRRASFEAEVEAAPALNSLKTPYVDITYQWKGWNAKTPNILEIIKEIDNRFKFNFYPPNVLNTTTKIQFYNVQLRMNVYQEGIDTLMNLPLAKLEAVLMKGNKLGYMEGGKEEVTRKERKLLERFGEAQAEYRKFRGKGKDMSMEMAKAAQYMVSMLEMALPARAFIELLGGERNIYVKSSINGFRVNDPSGDSEILSATIGEIGYFRKHAGPLRFQSSNLGMTESEFFIFWLMTKI